MGGKVVSPLLLAALLLEVAVRPGCCVPDCPWQWEELQPWSAPSTWPSGTVPQINEHVVIASGRRVLLDVEPPPLGSLTVAKGAALVWGDVEGLQLSTGYLLVDGEFHLGSLTCRFQRAARIKLTGLSNSTTYVESHGSQDRKMVMVRDGGTLELHGQEVTSWTRLAQTLPRRKDLACSAVYNHSSKDNLIGWERGQGLHVLVWNNLSNVLDFNIFSNFSGLREFVDSVEDGAVVAMHAFSTDGVGVRSGVTRPDFTVLDSVVSGLGGRLISSVNKGDAYSFLAVKGVGSSAVEYYQYQGRQDQEEDERYISLPVWDTGLAFQVATSAKTVNDYFRVVPVDVAFPILELAEEVRGWNPGDKIVVASTDFDWEQAEVREIIHCPDCSRSQVRVNESFRYRHYGNFTYDVDERAEVGLLSRNIVIEGVMEPSCYYNNNSEQFRCRIFQQDTFGGHIKVMRGFQSVHIEGVELYHMGQQGVMGSYPLHYHLCDEVPGSWFRDNAIHHSFQRCVTIHGTDYAEVSGNVCYDHLGHGYFLEDSAEQNNVLHRNLGLATRHGTTLMSDLNPEWCVELYGKIFEENCNEVSTFWLTHPNNNVSHNAAAGGEGHGFMMVFAIQPLGPSYYIQQRLGKVKLLSARHTPIQRFYGNAAHSNAKSGLFFDSYLSTGRRDDDYGVPENGVIQKEPYYEPRDPPGDPNGTHVWTKIERLTVYKNIQNNAWVKAGDVNMSFCSFADAAEKSFSGGLTGFWTGSSTEHSIFIGRSDNLGEPRLNWREVAANGTQLVMDFPASVGKSPWVVLTGVDIYQGPMLVKHSYFDRFTTVYWNDSWTAALGQRPVTYAAALGFRKDSTYPTYSSQFTTNLTFGFCDNADGNHRVMYGNSSVYDWMSTFDGPLNAFNRDADGSLTGTPNASLVPDRPFLTGPECLSRKDWNMAVCPYRYIKVEILGEGGNMAMNKKDQWALVAQRNDAPSDLFTQEGKQRREYLVRTGRSYLIDFNTTMSGAAFPNAVYVRAYGVDRQDVVRLGVCVPPDTRQFDINMEYPVLVRNNNFTRLSSLQELDNHRDPARLGVFHDTNNGIIFFKVWSLVDRSNDTQLCTGGLCYMLRLFLRDGSLGNIRSCLTANISSYLDHTVYPIVKMPDPCMSLGTSTGLGATRYEEVSRIVHEDFNPPCGSAPSEPVLSISFKNRVNQAAGRYASVYKNCYVDSAQSFVLASQLMKAMTVDWCVSRCYWKQFRYAGLTKGNTCKCGQSVTDTPEARKLGSRLCTLTCPGKAAQQCGNGERLAVWTTGLFEELTS